MGLDWMLVVCASSQGTLSTKVRSRQRCQAEDGAKGDLDDPLSQGFLLGKPQGSQGSVESRDGVFRTSEYVR